MINEKNLNIYKYRLEVTLEEVKWSECGDSHRVRRGLFVTRIGGLD